MDVVTMNIVESTMLSICREMGITMMKTSYSTIFNESLDFSCAVADANGDMIAVADYCPGTDRRHDAPHQVLHPRDGGRARARGRCHRAQRPLPGRPAHAGAHLLHAHLRGRQVHGLRGGDRPCGPRSAAWCRAASPARRRRSSTRACASPRSRSRSRARTWTRVWKLLLANVRTPRYNYGDYRSMISALRARRRAHGRGHREVRRAALPRDDRGPHGLFRGPDAGRDRGDPRRHVFLRRLYGGRWDRRAPIPHRRRHGGAGGRDHRRFRPLRRPGERRDQRDPRRHLLRHLQRHAAPDGPLDPAQRRLLSAPSACWRGRRLWSTSISRRRRWAATRRPTSASATR